MLVFFTNVSVMDIQFRYLVRYWQIAQCWPYSSPYSNFLLQFYQIEKKRYLVLFRFFLVLDGFEWFWIKSLQKNTQLMLESLKAPFLVLYFFLLYINDLPDNVAICASDTSLHPKCDQASNLWQQLELVSKLESDLRDTVDWGRTRLIGFNAVKTQFLSFDWSNNTGTADVNMDGYVLEENSSVKRLWLSFSFKLDWGSYIISVAKTVCKSVFVTLSSC